MVSCACPIRVPFIRRSAMAGQTCAACDYPLDENAIQVTIGGRSVEVCCEECAHKLREARDDRHA
jgi:hypothetical protein